MNTVKSAGIWLTIGRWQRFREEYRQAWSMFPALMLVICAYTSLYFFVLGRWLVDSDGRLNWDSHPYFNEVLPDGSILYFAGWYMLFRVQPICLAGAIVWFLVDRRIRRQKP